jgi:hypothetical protein
MSKPSGSVLRSLGRRMKLMALAEMHQRSDRMEETLGTGQTDRSEEASKGGLLEDFALPSVVFL